MMLVLNPHYMVSLALIFVLVVTGAWRKSYSTTAFLIAVTIAMYGMKDMGTSCGHGVLNIISFIMVVRAILHKQHDKLIKG